VLRAVVDYVLTKERVPSREQLPNYVVNGHHDRSRPRATFLLGEAFSLAIGIDPQTIDRPNSLGIISGVGQILDPLLNPVEWFMRWVLEI